MASSGRGGAGNIVPQSSAASPIDNLETPSIKSPKYTTGRGGSGNIANNNPADPEEARRSQDVGPALRRYSENESHFGRGGAANTIKLSPEEVQRAKEENARIEREAKEREGKPAPSNADKVKGLAEKGKDMLRGRK
ncbi:MAG: hypothetical protein MMC23_002230 [Stictis urceolatum]|nr:hypothetical protein [Stictis urceolata]